MKLSGRYRVILAALFLPFVVTGCGKNGDSGQFSAPKAAGPDLRFASKQVQMMVGGVPPFIVERGALFRIPCHNQGWRAIYRYINNGDALAGVHKNASLTSGTSAYFFDHGSLAAGSGRSAYASFKMVPNPNVPTIVTIALDGTFAVAESIESNNRWYAKVVRHCP